LHVGWRALTTLQGSGAYCRSNKERVAQARAPTPSLGSHSIEILHDVGYEDDEIAALVAGRVVQPA